MSLQQEIELKDLEVAKLLELYRASVIAFLGRWGHDFREDELKKLGTEFSYADFQAIHAEIKRRLENIQMAEY